MRLKISISGNRRDILAPVLKAGMIIESGTAAMSAILMIPDAGSNMTTKKLGYLPLHPHLTTPLEGPE